MDIFEVKNQLKDYLEKKKQLENYLKIGVIVEVLEIEDAIKNYEIKIENLKKCIHENK